MFRRSAHLPMRGHVAEPVDTGGFVGGVGFKMRGHELNSFSQLSCFFVTVTGLCFLFSETIMVNVPYRARGKQAPTRCLG